MSLIRERNDEFLELLEMLKPFFPYKPEEKSRFWMEVPNPNFGGVAPIDLIILGRGHKVRAFIESAKEGY